MPIAETCPVIRHPKCAQAEAARLRLLKQSVEDDRESAIAALRAVIAKLADLCARGDAAELRTMAAECAVFIGALRSIDVANPGDDVADQLHLIQRRLRDGLDVIAKYDAGAPA